MERRRLERRRGWALGTLACVAAWLAWLNACAAPLRIDPLERRSPEPATDARLELARTYAPWIYHAVHPTRGRQDIPAPVDFDGNLDGDDNWESFPRCELVPTVYYAHLETQTHHFLTYHVFHPRDWATLDFGLHQTHEGDGENLQVVVVKASGRVSMLFTQAHYCGEVYDVRLSPDRGGVRGGELVLVNERGQRDSERGTHPAVFVESGGHGIYGVDGRRDDVTDSGVSPALVEHGIVFRPAVPGELASEPSLDAREPVPYQLESTTAKMWPGVRSGELVGRGRLLDGTVRYEDERVSTDLPKFHRGDRFSGPFGSSRGISPFAVDFGWRAGTLGALFFDPARRYRDVLGATSEPWSLEYVDYPFATR